MGSMTLPPHGRYEEPEKRYTREDIEEFAKEHQIPEEAIEKYNKSRRIEDLMETGGLISFLICLVSVLSLFTIPIFSIISGFIVNEISSPELISGVLQGTPTFETSTLVIVGAVSGLSFLLSISLLKLSSVFRSHAQETEVDDWKIAMNYISESYYKYKDGKYKESIQHLEECDTFRGRSYIRKYIDSAKVNGNIDKEFMRDNFECFIGIMIEYNYPQTDRRDQILSSIVEKKDNEYYTSIDPSNEDEEIEVTNTSYAGIIREVMSNIMSSIPNRLTLFSIERPMGIHIVFLVIGVSLIRVNPTLSVVAVTILTGGFESWRRSRISKENSESSLE